MCKTVASPRDGIFVDFLSFGQRGHVTTRVMYHGVKIIGTALTPLKHHILHARSCSLHFLKGNYACELKISDCFITHAPYTDRNVTLRCDTLSFRSHEKRGECNGTDTNGRFFNLFPLENKCPSVCDRIRESRNLCPLIEAVSILKRSL